MPDELPLGFSYFGKGNGLPYCIADQIVAPYRGAYTEDPRIGIPALEPPPPEGGWPDPENLPNQLLVGDFDYLTLSQAFMLAYNVSSVKLSSSITLGGFGNETITTPTEFTFPSWGDMYAIFRQSVEDFDESEGDSVPLSYGRTFIVNPVDGEPYRSFVFDGCSSTASPSNEEALVFFDGTPELSNIDYYYHALSANAGYIGNIIRIVDEETGLPIGDEGKTYIYTGVTSVDMSEDSNNYFGFLSARVVATSIATIFSEDAPVGINITEFNIDHPDGDFRLWGVVDYPDGNTIIDPAAENLTVNEISFREYS